MPVSEQEDVAVGELRDPLERARRPIFEQVLVHLPRRAVNESDALPAELEAKVEGQVAHEPLRALVGVRVHATDPWPISRSFGVG